jgi:hypothetical protein
MPNININIDLNIMIGLVKARCCTIVSAHWQLVVVIHTR